MNDSDIKKYCELIIQAGINLYKGQNLIINSGYRNLEFAQRLAETAYEQGAKFVDIIFTSNALEKYRVNSNDSPSLEYFPNYVSARNHELVSSDFAYIKIDNLEDIDELNGIDTDKYSIISKNDQQSNKPLSIAVSTSRITWCIVAAPGPLWASKVFGKAPSPELVEELWKKLIKVLRLDKPDPVAAWRANAEKLIARSKTLTDFHLDKLIFTGPETDLEIGLSKNCIWKGGMVKSQSGRDYIPNIPTEEVFTTPDYKRTNGKVKVTRPVKVLENLLTEISFEFKDGELVNYKSDKQEILNKFVNTDEGAKFLGEVALVDKNSEVNKSGLIFNSILYDENAACHIALGRGIPMCFSNKDELNTPEVMKKNGCNFSLVHTDFMIGSNEINVTGINAKREKLSIIKEGEFQI